MKLSNRTVLITGGTNGIGLGIAEAFQKAGSKVIVCGRDKEKLAAAEKKNPGFTAIACDVGNAQQRQRLASEVLERFPGLDVLVNNAGIQRYLDLKKGYDDLKAGGDEIAVNFVATVELTALFIGHLMKKPSAEVINVGSGLGFTPMTNTPVYSATKAAVHVYSLVLRQQLKDTPVKVIEIIPPMVDTGLNKEGRDAANRKFRGISLAEYLPTVMAGLESGSDTVYHGDGGKIMIETRGESERRYLKP
jgi:uncharacterized oxidoreductase